MGSSVILVIRGGARFAGGANAKDLDDDVASVLEGCEDRRSICVVHFRGHVCGDHSVLIKELIAQNMKL